MNCTYSHYTEAAATCSAAQQHKTLQLMSSEGDCCRLLDDVCEYTDRKLHLLVDIRVFKQIQVPAIALPQIHRATQHAPTFLSGDCEGALVAKSVFRMR